MTFGQDNQGRPLDSERVAGCRHFDGQTTGSLTLKADVTVAVWVLAKAASRSRNVKRLARAATSLWVDD